MRRIKIQLVKTDGSDRIAPSAIDWSRYMRNPVVLFEHNWGEPPVGILTDINTKRCSGKPKFHKQTPDSVTLEKLYKRVR